jgi:hypothetical protein
MRPFPCPRHNRVSNIVLLFRIVREAIRPTTNSPLYSATAQAFGRPVRLSSLRTSSLKSCTAQPFSIPQRSPNHPQKGISGPPEVQLPDSFPGEDQRSAEFGMGDFERTFRRVCQETGRIVMCQVGDLRTVRS